MTDLHTRTSFRVAREQKATTRFAEEVQRFAATIEDTERAKRMMVHIITAIASRRNEMTITATVNRHRRNYDGSYVIASHRFDNRNDGMAYVEREMRRKNRHLVYGVVEGTDVDGIEVYEITETDGGWDESMSAYVEPVHTFAADPENEFDKPTEIEERDARIRATIGWLENVLVSPVTDYPTYESALAGAGEWTNDTWRNYR